MKHRKFTVRMITPQLPGENRPESPVMIIVADYMRRRETLTNGDVYEFWVKRPWYQPDLMVGCYEARCYVQVSSEETTDDVTFLSEIGVRP